MNTELDIKISAGDLFRFNLRQSYMGFQGPVSVIIMILFSVSAVVSVRGGSYANAALYIAIALLFLLYIPITLWARSKKKVQKDPVLSGTLHYVFRDDAIEVSQGDQSAELPWDRVYKIIATKRSVLIFSNRFNAYILPKNQIGNHYQEIKALAQNKLEKFRCHM